MIAVAEPPFVHVFANDGRWYAYDVNTNDLLEVDAGLGLTLAALVSPQPARALERLTAEIGREAVGDALAEIEVARREERLFSCRRPRMAPRRLTDDDRATYGTKLSHLILTVTEDCNLACRYCPQAAARTRLGTQEPRAMSRDTALSALALFAAHSREAARPAVSFYGGEPLLRQDLIREVIHMARGRSDWPDFRFFVTTNATLLDDEAVDLIAREGLHLQVSLDGPPLAHDRWRVYRDGRGSHADVMAGLERVLRRDPGAAERLCFQITAAPPFDFEALGAWFDDFEPFRSLGVARRPRLRINYASLSWRGDGPADETPTQCQISHAHGRWIDACAAGRRDELDPVTRGLFDPSAMKFYHRPRVRMPEAISPGGCCLPGARRLNVTPDGVLEPCERAAAKLRIGSVDRGISVTCVAALMESYALAVRHRCCECWAVRLCSLCYAALDHGEGAGGLVMAESRCQAARNEAASMLKLYSSLLSRGESAAAFLRDSCVT